MICTVCGRSAAPGSWRCRCGGPLDLPEVGATALSELGRAPRESEGLWRYRAAIPVAADLGMQLSLGEGQTPLVAGGADLPGVSIKVEYAMPTLSFKDRGAVVLVAAAVQRGSRRLIADSSGNAGGAIAAYASRAGLDCTVFVPERTSMRKQSQISSYGATVVAVPGDRTATARAAVAEVERTGAAYGSHVYDPYFLQGTKTFAFELWEQLPSMPDALVLPVGNGTLLLGAARGCSELRAAGLTDGVPRIVALQSERCAPLARAWDVGLKRAVDLQPGVTAAEGIAIPSPPRGAQILRTVRELGGCMVEVPEAAIGVAQRDLARRGLYVEPTAALTWAGLLLARAHPSVVQVKTDGGGWQLATELTSGTVVVPACGSGLKSA
jgi:threonine synthase